METQQQENKKGQARKSFGYLQRGLKYGLLTLVVAFLMGAIYGSFNLAPLQPAFAVASFIGIIVVLNLIIAFALWILWLLLYIFSRKKYLAPKYFLISIGFSIIFLSFFGLLKLTNFYIY